MLLASNLSFYPREGFHQSRCAEVYLPRPRLASGEIGPNAVLGHRGRRIPTQPAQQVWSQKGSPVPRPRIRPGGPSTRERRRGARLPPDPCPTTNVPAVDRHCARVVTATDPQADSEPSRAPPTIDPDISGQRGRGTPWPRQQPGRIGRVGENGCHDRRIRDESPGCGVRALRDGVSLLPQTASQRPLSRRSQLVHAREATPRFGSPVFRLKAAGRCSNSWAAISHRCAAMSSVCRALRNSTSTSTSSAAYVSCPVLSGRFDQSVAPWPFSSSKPSSLATSAARLTRSRPRIRPATSVSNSARGRRPTSSRHGRSWLPRAKSTPLRRSHHSRESGRAPQSDQSGRCLRPRGVPGSDRPAWSSGIPTLARHRARRVLIPCSMARA